MGIIQAFKERDCYRDPDKIKYQHILNGLLGHSQIRGN